MANESKKDFNAKLNDSKDMPKIIELDEQASKKWGGKTMVVAPPIEYDAIIKTIPNGKLITVAEMRKRVANNHHVDICCPLTAGIFTNIVAWASYQRKEDITPYWRVVKDKGELNIKFPESCNLQKKLLESEGFTIYEKNNRYYVKDYEQYLV